MLVGLRRLVVTAPLLCFLAVKPGANISGVGYSDEYRADFERLNLKWITGYFRVEGLDREHL